MQAAEFADWRPLIHVRAVGLDEASEQLAPIMHVRYVQLERGAACMQGTLARLGRVIVGRFGGDRNKIEWIDTPPGRALLLVPSRGVARLGTTTIEPQQAVLVSSAMQLVAFTDRNFLPIVISLDANELAELVADRSMDSRVPMLQREVSVLGVSPVQALALDRLVQAAFEAATAHPNALHAPGTLAALGQELLSWCAALLNDGLGQPHSSDGAAARRRAALRAREFVDTHLDQPLSLARVCRASYSSARALEYGFREMFGLAPMAYVRFARLSRVRHDLYFAQPRDGVVTRLAMKWGFCHLGQFSKDYCALFGELPSTTLGRGNAGAGAESLPTVRKNDSCTRSTSIR